MVDDNHEEDPHRKDSNEGANDVDGCKAHYEAKLDDGYYEDEDE